MANLNPEIVHPGVHPLVLALDRARLASGLSWAELERRAGVGSGVTHPWRHGASAITLQNLEALFNTLGRGLRDVLLVEAHSNTPGEFHPGYTYLTVCGSHATITAQEGHLLIGLASIARLDTRWTLQGKVIPLGGVHPFDLVRRL